MLRRIIYILTFFIFNLIGLFAQSLVIDYPNEIYRGEPFNIRFIYKGETDLSADMVFEGLPEGLQILYGPSTSVFSSSTIINGKLSQSIQRSYTYTVIAASKGKFTIPKAYVVDANGKKLFSKESVINILESTKSNNRQNSANNKIDNTANIRREQKTNVELFTPVLSKKTAYVNEPIFLQLKIYHLLNGMSVVFDKYPIMNGFLNEKLSDGSSDLARLDVEEYGGKYVRTITFGNTILIPQKSGMLSVGPIKSKIKHIIETGDIYDFFSSGTQMVEQDISSNTVPIEIKPLPEENKPADFSGMVGQFDIKLEYDNSKNYKTGDAITFKVTVSGKGYLKTLDLMKPNFPSSFDSYDPTSTYVDNISEKGINSTKIFEYIFVPIEKGKFEIAPFSLSYFDPKAKSYKTIKTQAISLNIEQGNKSLSNSSISNSKQKEYDAEYLHNNNNFSNNAKGLEFFASLSYVLIYIFIVVISAISYFFINRYRKAISDTVSYNSSKADRIASKRLKTAYKHVVAKDIDLFYEELMKSLWQYASYKFKIPYSDINMANVLQIFDEKNISNDDAKEFEALISLAEYSRYSPTKSSDELLPIYDRAINLIKSIEKQKTK